MTANVGDKVDEAVDVKFVPVPGANQNQALTANVIVAALGGVFTPDKDGDKVVPQEGWVPPSNRDGETAKEDRWLGKDKVARLAAIAAENDLGNFPRILDPRDNDKAPDTWEEHTPDDKAVEESKKLQPNVADSTKK